MVPEFPRPFDLRQIGNDPIHLEPDADERRRLAARFAISSIESMSADLVLEPKGREVNVTGRFKAQIVQACAISGDDFPVSIDEPIQLRFVPAQGEHAPGTEIELIAEDCDEIEYEGTSFDLGEAVAQSLGLAIDPFAEGPNADAARKAAGLLGPDKSGPFAALAALRKDD
jgi:uncharacterized metal-binding protein YceD (DUF177 family)